MAIAKKIENTPILPNFNTDPFLTLKLIMESSYAFALFLQWICILTKERNLQNKHFGRNYPNNKEYLDELVELLINCLSSVILVIQFHKPKSGMLHPEVLLILELCLRKTFYHKITTWDIITGFLTKLAVILCTFYFWLSTSDFWRKSSSKSAFRSWSRKLNDLRVKPAH